MRWFFLGIFLCLAMGGVAIGGIFPRYSLADGDQDVHLQFDGQATLFVTGDIDGDGHLDALVSYRGDTVLRPRLGVIQGTGRRWPRQSSWTALTTTLVLLRPGEELLGLIDLDGDGREDLVLWSPTALRIVRGWDEWPAEIDLGVTEAQVTVPLSGGLSGSWKKYLRQGDFNGDGRSDLVYISIPIPSGGGWTSIFILYGRNDFPATVDALDARYVQTWASFLGIWPPLVLDMNRDGYDDVVLGAESGGIYIGFGSVDPPGAWDVGTSSQSLRLNAGGAVYPQMVIDRRGDGESQLVYSEGDDYWVLDPLTLVGATGTVELSNVSPTRLTGYPEMSLMAAGDFDGDGRDDFVASSPDGNTNVLLKFFLTEGSPSRDPLAESEEFSFQDENRAFVAERLWHVADWDGDGRDDLFLMWKGLLSNISAQIGDVVYGFSPLKNPSIVVGGRDDGSKRAVLDLAVEGEPVEMNLSGDIEDEIQGRWIPFERRRRVSLTSAPGLKTVTAVFRIREGRESAPVSTSINVATEGPSVTVVTNRITGDGGAEVDCRVTGGRLQATVYERGGRQVKRVSDAEAAGVVTVDWDGRNEAGERVRPGVYLMTLEFDGRTEKTEILVEP